MSKCSGNVLLMKISTQGKVKDKFESGMSVGLGCADLRMVAVGM